MTCDRLLRLSSVLLLTIAASACKTLPAAPGAGSPLAGLAWMTGDWEGAAASGVFDEHWTVERGGLMLGLGREVLANGTFFEYMRLESRPDGIYYVPQPKGKPPHDFKLIELKGTSAVFESPGGDRVSRVSYQRIGNELHARVQGEGIDDAYQFVRQ